MTSWEYLFVRVDETNGVWKPSIVNREELVDWKNGPLVEQFIMNMGDEGWELVSFCPVYVDTRYGPVILYGGVKVDWIQVIFKRPKL